MVELAQRLRWLRWSIVTEILLFVLQYEFGVALTVSGAFPSVAPSGFSLGTFASYVGTAGGALVVHAVFGVLLFAIALLIVVLALGVKVRWFRIATLVAFLFVLSAGLGGMLFVLSGFLDDSFSYQMSTGFIIALAFMFLSLYLIKEAMPQAASTTTS